MREDFFTLSYFMLSMLFVRCLISSWRWISARGVMTRPPHFNVCEWTEFQTLHIPYPTPAPRESFMHENIWPVISDAMVQLETQFLLSYVPSRLESECVLVKSWFIHTRRLLHPQHQIDMATLLSTLTTTVKIQTY